MGFAQVPPCPTEAQMAAQCDDASAAGYTTLKTFLVELGAGSQEHSYILSKDTEYLFSLCTGATAASESGITFTLLDAYYQPLLSNFDKKTKKHMAKIGYYSQSTGVVHFKIEHQTAKKSAKAKLGQYCGVLNLSFRGL